jgi:hypothetical protein
VSRLLIALAPVIAALPAAFWSWLHRDSDRFVDIIRRGGVCAQIGSGPVQLWTEAALIVVAMFVVLGAASAWRRVPDRQRRAALWIGLVLAIAMWILAWSTADIGAIALGCWR